MPCHCLNFRPHLCTICFFELRARRLHCSFCAQRPYFTGKRPKLPFLALSSHLWPGTYRRLMPSARMPFEGVLKIRSQICVPRPTVMVRSLLFENDEYMQPFYAWDDCCVSTRWTRTTVSISNCTWITGQLTPFYFILFQTEHFHMKILHIHFSPSKKHSPPPFHIKFMRHFLWTTVAWHH